MRQSVTINGVKVGSSPKEVYIAVLSCVVTPDIKFWSPGGLRRLYVGAVELCIEYCRSCYSTARGGDKAKITRFIKRAQQAISYIPKERTDLLNKIYNELLTAEGAGLLPRFGITNKFKDTIPGNPEYTSILSLTGSLSQINPVEYNIGDNNFLSGIKNKGGNKVAKDKKKTNKKKAAEKTAGGVTRQALVKAAKEMNDVLGIEDPLIDIKLKEPKLREKLIEGIQLIDGDEFTKETQTVIDALKPAPATKEEKPEKKKGAGGTRMRTTETRSKIEELVGKGKHTRKEIVETVMSSMDATKSTVSTILSDGKNPKYCQFDNLIKEDKETKILSWGKKRAA